MRHMQLLALLAVLCAALAPHRADAGLKSCSEKKVYVLDLSAIAGDADHSSCNQDSWSYQSFRIGPRYCSTNRPGNFRLAHWWPACWPGPPGLCDFIRTSSLQTTDPRKADFVLVCDYCIYMQGLAQGCSQTAAGSPESSGSSLVTAYNAMMTMPRWQANNGTDYIFYHPLPGLAGSAAMQMVSSSIHLTTAQSIQQDSCKDCWTSAMNDDVEPNADELAFLDTMSKEEVPRVLERLRTTLSRLFKGFQRLTALIIRAVPSFRRQASLIDIMLERICSTSGSSPGMSQASLGTLVPDAQDDGATDPGLPARRLSQDQASFWIAQSAAQAVAGRKATAIWSRADLSAYKSFAAAAAANEATHAAREMGVPLQH